VRTAGALLAAVLLALGPVPAAAQGGNARVAQVSLVDALPPAPSVEERLGRIRERIQGALRYPPSARWRQVEGVARVRFEIDAEGRAHGLETSGSSGHWVLDRAAERAVEDAAPLPYVWGRLEVPVRFSLER